jgi:hypothetical protein
VVRLVPAGVLDVMVGGCLADGWLLSVGTGGLVLDRRGPGSHADQPRSQFALTASEHAAPGPRCAHSPASVPISWAPMPLCSGLVGAPSTLHGAEERKGDDGHDYSCGCPGRRFGEALRFWPGCGHGAGRRGGRGRRDLARHRAGTRPGGAAGDVRPCPVHERAGASGRGACCLVGRGADNHSGRSRPADLACYQGGLGPSTVQRRSPSCSPQSGPPAGLHA